MTAHNKLAIANKDKVMRIGLMGYNCNKANAAMALAALEDALKNCQKTKS